MTTSCPPLISLYMEMGNKQYTNDGLNFTCILYTHAYIHRIVGYAREQLVHVLAVIVKRRTLESDKKSLFDSVFGEVSQLLTMDPPKVNAVHAHTQHNTQQNTHNTHTHNTHTQNTYTHTTHINVLSQQSVTTSDVIFTLLIVCINLLATVGLFIIVSHIGGVFKLQWFQCSRTYLGISLPLQESY